MPSPRPQPATPTLELRLAVSLARFGLDVALTSSARALGIFGPSGAGKSTLLAAVAGLRRATGRVVVDGEVWLDSQDRVDLPPERRDVGYVPQEGLLFPHLDVRGNLLAGARRARRRGLPVAETFATSCAILRLEPLLDRRVGELSGGERQRVALGRALCSGPRLLLLDEPLAALDLPLRRALLPYLRRVRDEMAIPMLIVSHDPVEVQALCDEVAVLDGGRILAQGAPGDVLTDPRVFPLAPDGYENVLAGTHAGHRDGAGRLRLAGGLELATGPLPGVAGDPILVGLAAHDILLAVGEVRGLSAQNVVAATVERIETLGELRLVLLRLGGELPLLAVEVTEGAHRDLRLAAGVPVRAVIKARSFRVYGEKPSRLGAGSRMP